MTVQAPVGTARPAFQSPIQNHGAALLYYLGGVGLLSLLDATIKDVASRYPTFEVAFLRYALSIVLIGAIAAWLRPGWPSRELIGANMLRSAIMAALSITFFFSLTALPLAEAVALSFLSPAFLALFGAWLLKEKLNPRIGIALGVGFLGVMVIVGGKFGQANYGPLALLGAGAALISAVLYALSLVMLRARAQRDPIVSMLLVLNIGSTALLAVPALLVWKTPTPVDWLIFAAAAVFGTSGHLLLANAFARSQAGRLAPFEYTALIWASGLGLLVFGEAPGLTTIIGAGFIIVSALIAERG